MFMVRTWFAALLLSVPLAASAADTFTSSQIAADLAVLRRTLHEQHPQPSYCADLDAIDVRIAQIEAALPAASTRDEAWRQLATLNPLFADGHTFVGLPDWRGDTAALLAGGGRLFPFEVAVADDGRVRIRAALGGAATPLAGAEIVAIDGTPAADVAGALLDRTYGDTPAFRRELLSRRWWLLHWKQFGAPDSYALTLRIDGEDRVQDVAGSATRPELLQREDDQSSQLGFELHADGSATLRIDTFAPSDDAAYYAFTEDAFRRMRAAGTRRLVVDVSRNDGGDDAYWMKGLLRYVAKTPYRWTSGYTKRVLAGREGDGEKAGDVVRGTVDAVAPDASHGLMFDGDVEVRIGPYTYSSAIVFANVVRDHGYGRIVGATSGARRGQTGGVYPVELPNTGLPFFVPRFVLQPPGGGDPYALLQPVTAVSASRTGAR